MKVLERIPWQLKGFRFHGDGSMTVPANWEGHLPPIELARRMPPLVEANFYTVPLAEVERPEDCSKPCWRRGGDEACTCDDYDEDGTTEGGW